MRGAKPLSCYEEKWNEGIYKCLDKILVLMEKTNKDDMENTNIYEFDIEKISEDEMRIISEEDNIDTIVKRN